jgi:2-iminoacetate synthase ThiH
MNKNSRRADDLHPSAVIPPPLKEGEDFYREGAFVVFTARYHLRRGYCCESGCRHCPYRAAPEVKDEEKSFEKSVE